MLRANYSKIKDGLYLSDILTAQSKDVLKELKVTHIITLDIVRLDPKPAAPIQCLFLQCNDHWEEDLISLFPAAIQFIDAAIENRGVVLVHCVAGISRSATIVVAYLMWKQRQSYNDAFDKVYGKRDIVDPNHGFRGQLALWESMGWKIDVYNKNYRKVILRNLKYKIKFNPSFGRNEGHDHHSECDPISLYFKKQMEFVRGDVNLKQATYKCKKCKLYLFKEYNLISMDQENGTDKEHKCSQLFIEPLQWMLPHISLTAYGQLSCPNCLYKLGSFDWNGLSCENDCNVHIHVLPGFRVDINKIDCH